MAQPTDNDEEEDDLDAALTDLQVNTFFALNGLKVQILFTSTY